jgi:GNAT superfamily N-acetyltransferase
MQLVRATEEQKAQRDPLTWPAWGSTLSVQGYCTREQRLRAHPWSRAAMDTWLLCAEGGEVLASCETFRTDSSLRAEGGSLTAGQSWAIASVFTEERLRGHGHATRLMRLLAEQLAHASPQAQCAVLFSDVGPALYRRAGWEEAPAWDWSLPPAEGRLAEGVEALVREEELPAALARIRRPQAPFFLWPSAEQLDWHLERSRIYAELLERPRPEACGAVVGESTALWAMVARYGELLVLMLDARSAGEAQALLGVAQRVARQCKLERVVVWEEPAHAALLAQVPGARREPREGSLPMLRPLREGLPPVASVPFPRGLWV